MARIGYARVSTADQTTENQRIQLEATCDLIFTENVSAVAKERPELERAMRRLGKDDTLVVVKIDRLARSLVNLLEIIQEIQDKGANFESLSDPIDTASASGRLMMMMIGAFAEFERALIRERTRDGVQRAIRQGKRPGNPQLKAKEPRALLKARVAAKAHYDLHVRRNQHLWVPIVLQLRTGMLGQPRLPWKDVTRHVNERLPRDRPYSSQALRNACRHLVKAGEMDPAVLEPIVRTVKVNQSAVNFIARLLRQNPGIKLREIVDELHETRIPPPRKTSEKWSITTVASYVARAREQNDIEAGGN